MYNIKTLALTFAVLVMLPACSAYMAANQPGQKDVSLFAVGQPRAKLIAEFGSPIHTEVAGGIKKDIFTFVQGYHGAVRAGRAIGHAVAGVATLGLWEIIGTPTEGYFNGDKVSVEITYDGQDRITRVVPLKGHDQLAPAAAIETSSIAPPSGAPPGPRR